MVVPHWLWGYTYTTLVGDRRVGSHDGTREENFFLKWRKISMGLPTLATHITLFGNKRVGSHDGTREKNFLQCMKIFFTKIVCFLAFNKVFFEG